MYFSPYTGQNATITVFISKTNLEVVMDLLCSSRFSEGIILTLLCHKPTLKTLYFHVYFRHQNPETKQKAVALKKKKTVIHLEIFLQFAVLSVPF